MQNWRPIFSGTPEAARDLAKALESRGVRSFVDDREGPVATPSGARSGFSAVRVPPDEFDAARGVASDWSTANAHDADTLWRRFLRILALALLAPALWGIAEWLAPDRVPAPSIGGVFVVWLVAVVAVAQFEDQRHQRERSP